MYRKILMAGFALAAAAAMSGCVATGNTYGGSGARGSDADGHLTGGGVRVTYTQGPLKLHEGRAEPLNKTETHSDTTTHP